MAETLSNYLDRWVSKSASGGLRNPLMKMPIKRFHPLSAEELSKIGNSSSFTLGTRSDPIARNLLKNYQDKIRERGEHTGYVTLGSVEVTIAGTVAGAGSKTALMPVWLQRVVMGLNSRQETIYVEPMEEQIWDLNPELEPALARFGIKLDSGPKDPVAFVDWLSAQCGNRATVERNASYVGCFSSQHLLIRERIKDSRWRRAVAQNDAIRAKVLNESGDALPEVPEITNDGNLENLGLVLPIDDSQLRVVQMASGGHSLVVQGPPGTGKSQTIANLISNAWWQGKRVMLVCDKQTAIQQVEERLQKCGLGAALLNIHDEGLEKKLFLSQAVASFSDKEARHRHHPFQELAQLREVLNRRVTEGEQAAHGSIPIKRREALSGMIRLRKQLGTVPLVDIPNWQSLSRDRLAKLFTHLKGWEALKTVAADSVDVWNLVKFEAFRNDPNAKQELVECIGQLETLVASISDVSDLAVAAGWRSELVGAKDLGELEKMSDRIKRRPPYHAHLIDNSRINIAHLQDLRSAYDEKVRIEAAAHPVPLGFVTPKAVRNDAEVLLRAERCHTWSELVAAAGAHKQSIGRIEALNDDFQRLSSTLGLVPLRRLGERRAQLGSLHELLNLSTTVPTSWWDNPLLSPSGTLNRWEKELQSLSSHLKTIPLPLDLAALDRTPEKTWKHIEAKTENGFNGIAYCLRYVNDSKVKTALRQMYPGLGGTKAIEWADILLHCMKARAILMEVKNSSSVHPELRDITAGYCAASVTEPDVERLLSSAPVKRLREAARLVEAIRLRTDHYQITHSIWLGIWSTPNAARTNEVARCLESYSSLVLPDSVNDGKRPTGNPLV